MDWTESTKVPRLVGVFEASEILGVSRARVIQLFKKHPDFPPSVASLRATTVWVAQEIEEFQTMRQRNPGRRRKTTE